MELENKIWILDGGMGTMLQKKGMTIGGLPELMSLTNPEVIEEIHREYVESGSDIIYSNTFGANAYKLKGSGYSVDEIVSESVSIAKKAIIGTSSLVALDIGPIGQMLEPMGILKFEDAYDIFKEIIVSGVNAGADLIVIETMTDLYEVKAAVLAAKENSDLPVFVTMTFEENRRTFIGCSISEVVAVLEGLGVSAMGVNCSLGPAEIAPIISEISKLTTLPLIIKPNAGLPNPSTGEYDVCSHEFSDILENLVDQGVTIFGGCCGTTPEYIKSLKEKLKGKQVAKRTVEAKSIVCSSTKSVVIDGVKIIGERINPTGKKLLKEAIKNKDFNYIINQGLDQIQAGAHILDVNIGIPDINESELMPIIIKRLQAVLDTPLQIDSSDPNAIEAGLRVYNGKAIVNSVNGEEKVLERILPIVKKYGAAVVGLTLDEKGIPLKAEDRFIIAKKILDRALEYGIKKEDVYIDCLTLTASAQQEEVIETLKAIKLVKEKLGLKTVLGVSNISFGLPNRGLLNHSFFTMAMSYGLDLAIINPNLRPMTDAIYAHNVLTDYDKGSVEYIKAQSDVDTKPQQAANSKMTLDYAILKGLSQDSITATKELLLSKKGMDIVEQDLIPTLDKVGQLFETGKFFLPQLLQSAQAAQGAFDIIKAELASKGEKQESKGKIILATVKGDIHDIGKNIVKVILQNYGYNVIDLGKDVSVEEVVEVAKEQKVQMIGLSALMTTTMKNMELTISEIRKENINCKIVVGGAVLTDDYAKMIGADYYAKDAKAAIDIAKSIFK